MIVLKDSEFRELTNYIQKNYGINLSRKKMLIEGRLNNVLIQKGFNNYSQYMEYVFADKTGKEITSLINKLTTNYTYFMRESDHFKYFEKTVLPYLEKTVKNKDLRIWSAGCSSGEEPYTLEMIMRDYFQDYGALWNTDILATDISERVLELAINATYPEEAISNMPNQWKYRYFKKIDKENYQISDDIRNKVIFRIFNLMEENFPFKKKFHVIFCRNVMIYFDYETKMNLVKKFYNITEPGGFLFIGHSETISGEEVGYKSIMPSVYRKGF